MNNYKIVAFKEDLTYKYYVVDQDKDNYLIVMVDNINAYNKANKFDKVELWSEFVPKKELININGNMKLKKGSIEAKKFMAKIRSKKGKTKKVTGVKKTTKKKAVYKDNVKNVSDLIKKKIKSKKLIMPHGYQVSKSKLNGNSIGSINEKYITELNNINREIENAKQNINSLKTLKLNDLKNFKLGFKQELLDRYINRTKYLKKQLIQIKKQIK